MAQLLLNIDAEPADKMNLQALSFQDFMPGSPASSMSSQMEGSAIGLGTIGSSMLKPQACELVKVWVMDSQQSWPAPHLQSSRVPSPHNPVMERTCEGIPSLALRAPTLAQLSDSIPTTIGETMLKSKNTAGT